MEPEKVLYQGYAVSFQEVPDEVSVVFSIAGCDKHCPGCHSPHLWAKEGKPLEKDFKYVLAKYKNYATCVCFMGDGGDINALRPFIVYAWGQGFKTCLYTGEDDAKAVPFSSMLFLDYLKLGHYDEKLGGLDIPNTNQAMYKISWPDNAPVFQKVSFVKPQI